MDRELCQGVAARCETWRGALLTRQGRTSFGGVIFMKQQEYQERLPCVAT